jgi:hypothetical protein
MKSRLSDLNDHLFAQLERLADETMNADQLDAEVKRAEAIVAVADKITGNADLQLKAAKLFAEHGSAVLPMLPSIGRTEAKAVPSE